LTGEWRRVPQVWRQQRTRAVEGEVLGLVVPDGAEEGVVVGGALGGDLPSTEKLIWREAVMVGPFRGVLGGEGSVVALERQFPVGVCAVVPGGRCRVHVAFSNFEGRAEFRWETRRRREMVFGGRIGQAQFAAAARGYARAFLDQSTNLGMVIS